MSGNTIHRGGWLARLSRRERLNFLVTNRIPRRYATLLMGRIARIEQPLVRRASFALWRAFGGDLRLHEAESAHFRSVHECFTRRLRPGVRPIDPRADVVVSPCDAIVGAHGAIEGTRVFQAKGFPYEIDELLGSPRLVDKYRDGVFVTLRLTSNMYHRFHAPADARIAEVVFISGDTWNVNPIALERIERLYCKNERAVLDLARPDGARSLALVPVAAILVGSIRLTFLPERLGLAYRGPNRIPCERSFGKGDELGWFEHGSTIVLFATRGHRICTNVAAGAEIRMGEPLLREA